jgi:hypothetical protein
MVVIWHSHAAGRYVIATLIEIISPPQSAAA